MIRITPQRRRLALASVSLLAVWAGSSMAQEAPAAQGEAPSADTETIVVTGFRRSYADAVRVKRDAIQISDSISSDGLGRFPDLNVGEAIQRIPGIQINREADARNATISLRGLPGTFARTTLNGGAFADPILNGSTPLGAFASDIFSSITVIKSPTAADLAGGLSGNIDLRIAPALSRKDGGFVKLAYEYNSLGSLGSPLATIGYNKKITSDFAVFGVVAFKDEKFRRDSITVNSWGTRLGSIQYGNQQLWNTTSVDGSGRLANPEFDALMTQYPGGVYYPAQTRQLVRFNRGTLLSGAGGFEWRPAENWKIGANAFYTKRNLDESTNHLLYIDAGPGNNSNVSLGATSAVANITNIGKPYIVETSNGPRAYINSFTAENINTFDSVRSEPGVNSTWAINPSIEFNNDDWKLKGAITISEATAEANQIELDIVQNPYRNLTGLNGIRAVVALNGSDLSNYSAQLTTPNASHIPLGGYPIPAAGSAATQAGAQMPGQVAGTPGDRFGVTGTNGKAVNTLDSAQFDAERFFHNDGFFTSLQFGLRKQVGEFTSTGSRNTSLGTNADKITPAMASQLKYTSDFFGGEAPGYSSNWVGLDINAALAALTPVNTKPRTVDNPNGLPDQFAFDASTGVFLTPYGLVNNYWDANYWNNNFTFKSDVVSAYLMTNFKSEILSIPVRGTLGLRHEATRNTVTTLNCIDCVSARANLPGPVNHSLTTRQTEQEYSYTLPSFIIAADLTDTLVMRFAAYQTYVRPQPRDNVPVTTVQTPIEQVPAIDPVYSVVIGSTDLKPYTADSLDLSVEWYNRPGGLVALAMYEKKVDGYIGPITDQNLLCPADGLFDGQDFGLGKLTIDNSGVNPRCVSTNQFIGASGELTDAVVNVSGKTNQSPMTVRGVEFTVQQNFDFLPGFWKDFGGSFNVSYTTISGRDPAGNRITLPSVSKNNINLIGYYETKKFGVRVVYNWRDKYDLAAGNSFVGDARTVKARSQVDASASYNISDKVSVSLDAFNLTDATRSEYENDPMLPRRIDYDGRTYQITLRGTF